MSTLPTRTDISGAPNNATAKAALTAQYDFVAQRLAAGTSGAGAATAAELALARNTLGVASETFRNAVINGDFSSDQEYAGGSQTVTAAAAFKSVADCWYGICSGANVTAQRVQLSDKSFRLRFTGAASVSLVAAGHRITSEEVVARRMPGSKASIGVLLSSSSLTSITWRLYRANTENAFGTRASPTRTLIESGTFTINSTETRYTVTTAAVLPTTGQEGLELEFEGGALLGSQTLTIGDVQLEKSDVATPFETLPEVMNLARCKTQARSSYAKGTAWGTLTTNGVLLAFTAVATTADKAVVNVQFDPPMRATPTITHHNPVAAVANTWRCGDGSNSAISNSGLPATAQGFVTTNASATLAVGQSFFGHYSAKAYLF